MNFIQQHLLQSTNKQEIHQMKGRQAFIAGGDCFLKCCLVWLKKKIFPKCNIHLRKEIMQIRDIKKHS